MEKEIRKYTGSRKRLNIKHEDIIKVNGDIIENCGGNKGIDPVNNHYQLSVRCKDACWACGFWANWYGPRSWRPIKAHIIPVRYGGKDDSF